MLTWAKLTAPRVAYFENSVATSREDYYAGHGEAAGRFAGEGAARLGLSGELQSGQLERMAEGLHPKTGEQLLAWARPTTGERKPVAMYDMTASAPKSISLLYAGGDPHVSTIVKGCHDRAVRAALGVIEQEAAIVRRGAQSKIHEHAVGIIVAAYDHRTSRDGDPNLHTHAVIANMAQGSDGRYTALHGPALRQFMKAAGCRLSRRVAREYHGGIGAGVASDRLAGAV